MSDAIPSRFRDGLTQTQTQIFDRLTQIAVGYTTTIGGIVVMRWSAEMFELQSHGCCTERADEAAMNLAELMLSCKTPVCPRCLDINPGTPGGDPDYTHNGPYAFDLCKPCDIASRGPGALHACLSCGRHPDTSPVGGEDACGACGLGDAPDLGEEDADRRADEIRDHDAAMDATYP